VGAFHGPRAFKLRVLAVSPHDISAGETVSFPGRCSLGKTLFRIWILLFGLLSVEYDGVCLAEIVPGNGFVEISAMLAQAEWRRDKDPRGPSRRRVQASEHGDLGSARRSLWTRAGSLFRLVFLYRHYRLRRLFGNVPARGSATGKK
jgi:hypothetical protein